MKRNLLKSPFSLMLLGFFLINCLGANKFTVKDTDIIPAAKGLLAVHIEYLEGLNTFKNLSLKLQKLDNALNIDLSIKSNQSEWFLLSLPIGYYHFSLVKAIPNKFNGILNQDDTPFQGKFFDTTFRVEPSKINYIGHFTIQIYRQNKGKVFFLSLPDKKDKRPLYFFHQYNSKVKSQFQKEYPKLSQQYVLSKQKIFIHRQSESIKQKIRKQKSSEFSFDYGWENYGYDPNGYGIFKWMMHQNDVKSILENKKISYEAMQSTFSIFSKSYLYQLKDAIDRESDSMDLAKSHNDSKKTNSIVIDLANYDQNKLLSKLKLKKDALMDVNLDNLHLLFNEKNNLVQVIMEFQSDWSALLSSLRYQHGTPQNFGQYLKWELPNTFILSSKQNEKIRLIYLSKSILLNS